LEEILEGPMYVARLRQELARLAPTHQQWRHSPHSLYTHHSYESNSLNNHW
jgi:hypothetical protein